MVKQRDKSKKRNAIIEAAVHAFIEMGFDRASMDYIAEKAEASKRTVYNHFESKEVLFKAVIQHFVQQSIEEKQIPYQANVPLEAQLNKFAELKVGISTNQLKMNFMRMAFGVMITHPNIAAQVMENAGNNDDGLQAWLDDAVADGRLIIEDTALASEVFWSMCSSAFFWMPMLQGELDASKAEILKKEFVATFLARYSK